jgi:dienelactone hydrolase
VKRSLVLAAVAGLAVAAAGLTGCTPGRRYVDQVFSSTTKTTVAYRTIPDLTTGKPLTLVTDVYQPAGDTAAKRPVIVWIHGGGFKGGNRSSLADVAAAYARRGYVTLSIEYRLDPGNRCQELQDGKITDPDEAAAEHDRCERDITAAQNDGLAAVGWVRRHAAEYRADPNRIAVGGGSAGAVTALNVAQRANPGGGPMPSGTRVSAALAMSGCQYDPPAIDGNDAPISILASGGDQAVPFGCSVATLNAAKAAGTPTLGLLYPDESGHALALYKAHRAAVDQAWTAFLVDHLHLV